MRTTLITLFLILGTTFATYSQKYGYIDSDYILKNLTEYKESKDRLDKLADKWTKEVEEKYALIKTKKENFIREEDLLPTEEKTKREEEIKLLETEAMELQKQRFGISGDYFQKRQELIKPIQDKVYDAMRTIASKRNYTFIFDKANQNTLIFADGKFDISNDVLKELGVKPDNGK